MSRQKQINNLENTLKIFYQEKKTKVIFHGWYHIVFVLDKVNEIIKMEKNCKPNFHVDEFLCRVSALMHDLNYFVEPNSKPRAADRLREKMILEVGVEILPEDVNSTIDSAHTKHRDAHISNEAKILADADCIYKALAVTPIIFATEYLKETGTKVENLAEKICSEQINLEREGIYFYTDYANYKYLESAKANIELWKRVKYELSFDTDVRKLVESFRETHGIKY